MVYRSVGIYSQTHLNKQYGHLGGEVGVSSNGADVEEYVCSAALLMMVQVTAGQTKASLCGGNSGKAGEGDENGQDGQVGVDGQGVRGEDGGDVHERERERRRFVSLSLDLSSSASQCHCAAFLICLADGEDSDGKEGADGLGGSGGAGGGCASGSRERGSGSI